MRSTPQTNEGDVVTTLASGALNFNPGDRVYIEQAGRRVSGLIASMQYDFREPPQWGDYTFGLSPWVARLHLVDIREEKFPQVRRWWERLRDWFHLQLDRLVDIFERQTLE